MKKLKFFTALILVLTVAASLAGPLAAPAAAASDPAIEATSALLVETVTGEVLYSKNADSRIYPASTTKIMTVLLALEAIEAGTVRQDAIVTLSENIYQGCEGGSTAELESGEEISLEDLIRCALIASANEACNAIAEYISGSVDSFVSLMNNRAQELGCTNTHFSNCHGMPDDDHYLSVNDLFLIFSEARKYTLFNETVATATCQIPATNLSEARTLTTTDRLINPETTDYYDKSQGGKTGYTDAAGYCLVSSAKNDSLELTAIVMGCESVAGEDGTTQIKSFSESKRLYEWGFNSFGYRTLLSTADLIGEAPVEMGSGADSVILRPENSVVAFLDNDIQLEDFERNITIFSEETGEAVVAPVSAGDVLGSVTLTYNGREYGSVNLVASTSVSLSKTEYIHSEFKETLSLRWVKLLIAAFVLMFVGYIIFAIIYNHRQRKLRRAARAAAHRRAADARRRAQPTSGKSFEEIEREAASTAASVASSAAQDAWNEEWNQDEWK